jgi:hypothetical protein
VSADPLLCWLHDDNEPDHWMDRRDRVGVLSLDCGVVRRDQPPIPASRVCATRNGIEPERILDPHDGPWRS